MRGFTLLELLLVVAILALVAGGALLALEDTEDHVAEQVARGEMAEVVRALRAFRRDLGDWPRRGLLALQADGGRISLEDATHWPLGVPAARRKAWFDAPANLYQLVARPDEPWLVAVLGSVFGAGRVLDPDTGRGYHGPYLARNGERYVYVGPDLDIHGDGDPATGGSSDYLLVAGVADPFPVSRHPAPLYRWEPVVQPPTEELALGRPYLLFVSGALGPRLHCLGPNGAYESDATSVNVGGAGDDLCVLLEE